MCFNSQHNLQHNTNLKMNKHIFNEVITTILVDNIIPL